MIFINELKNMKLYRKKFYLPRGKENKRKSQAAIILSPNIESSEYIMNHKLLMQPNFYNSYYIEKNVSLFINEQSLYECASNFEDDNYVSLNENDSNMNSRYLEDSKISFKGDELFLLSNLDLVKSILSFYCNKFRIRLLDDISIIFTKDFTDSSMNTDKELYLPDYKDELFESIVKESIINFILKYRYPNNDNDMIDAISIVFSGLFDKVEDDTPICIAVKNLFDKSTESYNEAINIIKYNSYNNLINYYLDEANIIDSQIKRAKNSLSNIKRKITILKNKTSRDRTDSLDKANDNVKKVNKNLVRKESIEITDDDIISIDEAYMVKDNDYIVIGETITYFDESSATNSKLKNLLYTERIRNSKETIGIYNKIKLNNPFIKTTKLNLHTYRGLNLFVDLFYYNKLFFKNNTYTGIRGSELYFQLLDRQINNIKLEDAGYSNKVVLVPLLKWMDPSIKSWMIQKDLNPISVIYHSMKNNIEKLKNTFRDIEFVFIGDESYFKVNFNECDDKSASRFLILLRKVIENKIPTPEEESEEVESSKEAIKASIKDDIEENLDIVIKKSLTGDNEKPSKEKLKKEIINKIDDKIDDAASKSITKDDALDKLNNDDEFKAMILDLSTSSVGNIGPTMSKSRIERNNKLQQEVLKKSVKGKSIDELISKDVNSKLEHIDLDVDSLDESWKGITYPSQAIQYDPDVDIVKMLMSLSKKSYPINIVDINVEDTSTSEDYIYTYTVKLEGYNGKRFTLKFDIPKIKDNQYYMLRGNKKTINAQSFLLPVTKTDEDTTQIVSNYSKIFISRFVNSIGKSFETVDKIIRTLDKYEGKNITYTLGNNKSICSLYDLPLDYVDLASKFKYIDYKGKYKFYFNQDEIREKYSKIIDYKQGIPIGVNYIGNKEEIIYYNENQGLYCNKLLDFFIIDKEFYDIYITLKASTKYCYSKASILNMHIPLIVVIGYYIGILEALNRINVKYKIVEKRSRKENTLFEYEDYIKFSDGILIYENNIESSLLMNGLKECDTESYSIKDINSRFMYMDFIDNYASRIKCDGLDNFYDLMIDPITEDVLKKSYLPDNYIDLLLYANSTLSDNSYIQHADISQGKRIRRNELISGYFYKALSTAYGSYSIQAKHGRDIALSMKQSAVIDLFLQDPTASDLSIVNPLGEMESYATISSKGLSGMNTDRAYGVAERYFHDSMMGVYAMSTGFAATTGINRQLTINASIDGERGYVKTIGKDELNTSNSLCMTEALNPFITGRDDPFRTAMGFIQNSKHIVRCNLMHPSLVSNGSDQALPYLISDIFCTKSKFDGTVKEITDDYMIIEGKTQGNNKPETMYIDLSEKVEKNSSSGFFVVIKQSTDLKVGSKVKKGDVVAFDKSCFGNGSGIDGNVTYNTGTLAKCAILNTDEGFEDSAIISEALSNALTTPIVVQKTVDITKDTNIFNVIKKGTPVEEGDTLMVMQNSYDDEDANQLLKNLADDEETISSLGRIQIKSKITGVVQDIKIYRTVELDELSESLRKLCKEYESNINKKKKVMKSNNIHQEEELAATYKLPMSGKLKNVEGVRIEFYLKYNDVMTVGDKMIYYSALKGVAKTKFPLGDEPYSEYRKDERVDTMLPIASINARMTTAVMNVGVCNKLMIELSRQIKDMAGKKYKLNLTDID